jgi:tetratricopeptide (TPR) repeat protein
MASSGLTKDVFDFNINDVYPAGVKPYQNHLIENPMSAFEFSEGNFLLSLSLGNSLFRLDVYIPKSEKETYEKDNFNLISKFLNFLAWQFTESESYTKANTFIERSLEFAETEFNLDTAAVLNYKLGKLDNALEYINRSLGLDSEVSDHYVTRAKIFIALGDLVSAGNDLNKSIELDENNNEARDLLKII